MPELFSHAIVREKHRAYLVGGVAGEWWICSDLQQQVQVSAVPQGARRLRDAEGIVNVFPQRTERDAPECDFFMKTGHCKFGDLCRFHHPLSASVKLTAEGGYPLRPGQPVCPFYDRTGERSRPTEHCSVDWLTLDTSQLIDGFFPDC